MVPCGPQAAATVFRSISTKTIVPGRFSRFFPVCVPALAAGLLVAPTAAARPAYDPAVEAPRPGGPVIAAPFERPIDAPRPELVPAPRENGPVSAPRPKLRDRARPIAVAPRQIPSLIDRLDSDEYRDRQHATRLLKEAGAAAVEPLVAIAASGSLEAAVRAIRILQAIYVSGDDAAVDAAEAALERLKQATNPAVASRAEHVLALNYDVRERRAITEIERLGGTVHYFNAAFPDPRFPDVLRNQVQAVVLGKAWRGGDEGLKYVRRLAELPMLYLIDGTGAVSEQAEQQLLADMPELKIQHRSRACLGVGGTPGPGIEGCLVTQVKPGSAADRAGIQENDVIRRFGGKDVADFESMVKVIYDYEPGDRVKVEVERRGRALELDVVMDGWTDLEPRPAPLDVNAP
jgi:PDZ domain